jgi:hypothetical protein
MLPVLTKERLGCTDLQADGHSSLVTCWAEATECASRIHVCGYLHVNVDLQRSSTCALLLSCSTNLEVGGVQAGRTEPYNDVLLHIWASQVAS